jgi:hypothetical protein
LKSWLDYTGKLRLNRIKYRGRNGRILPLEANANVTKARRKHTDNRKHDPAAPPLLKISDAGYQFKVNELEKKKHPTPEVRQRTSLSPGYLSRSAVPYGATRGR